MMKFFEKCGYTLILPALIAMAAIWGCAAPQAPPEADENIATRGVTLVLPFVDMAKIFGDKASVRNPVTAKVFVTGTIEKEGATLMTNELYRLIGQETDLTWGSYAGQKLPLQYSSVGLSTNHVSQLQEIGRQKGADTIMTGYLYAFRDRSGSAFGVEKPSQVVFELVLIQTDTGRIMWQRSFKETQKSLAEDLTKLGSFIQRKGRWVSAREMASNALRDMLRTLPALEPKK